MPIATGPQIFFAVITNAARPWRAAIIGLPAGHDHTASARRSMIRITPAYPSMPMIETTPIREM